MYKKYLLWYKTLSPKKQFFLHFLIQYIYWGISWGLVQYYVLDKQNMSIAYLAIYSAWMALLFTLPFSWKKLQDLFKRKDDKQQ